MFRYYFMIKTAMVLKSLVKIIFLDEIVLIVYRTNLFMNITMYNAMI